MATGAVLGLSAATSLIGSQQAAKQARRGARDAADAQLQSTLLATESQERIAREAIDAQLESQRRAIEAQQGQVDQSTALFSPFRNLGLSALAPLIGGDAVSGINESIRAQLAPQLERRGSGFEDEIASLTQGISDAQNERKRIARGFSRDVGNQNPKFKELLQQELNAGIPEVEAIAKAMDRAGVSGQTIRRMQEGLSSVGSIGDLSFSDAQSRLDEIQGLHSDAIRAEDERIARLAPLAEGLPTEERLGGLLGTPRDISAIDIQGIDIPEIDIPELQDTPFTERLRERTVEDILSRRAALGGLSGGATAEALAQAEADILADEFNTLRNLRLNEAGNLRNLRLGEATNLRNLQLAEASDVRNLQLGQDRQRIGDLFNLLNIGTGSTAQISSAGQQGASNISNALLSTGSNIGTTLNNLGSNVGRNILAGGEAQAAGILGQSQARQGFFNDVFGGVSDLGLMFANNQMQKDLLSSVFGGGSGGVSGGGGGFAPSGTIFTPGKLP